MIFNCISNVPGFFKCINNCTGDVAFIDENGHARDLKQIAAHAETLKGLFKIDQLQRLEVRASALEDRQRLLRFMQEMSVR